PEHSDCGSLAKQRRPYHRAIAAESLRLAQPVFRIGLRIENLHGGALEQGPAGHALAPGLERNALELLPELGRETVLCLPMKEARRAGTSDMPEVPLAQSH